MRGNLFNLLIALSLFLPGTNWASSAPKNCELYNNARDFSFDFLMSTGRVFPQLEKDILKVQQGIQKEVAIGGKCSLTELTRANKLLYTVLGEIYLLKFDPSRNPKHLIKARDYFKFAIREGSSKRSVFLLGYTEVLLAWEFSGKESLKLEKEGLFKMWKGYKGVFGGKGFLILKSAKTPLFWDNKKKGKIKIDPLKLFKRISKNWQSSRSKIRDIKSQADSNKGKFAACDAKQSYFEQWFAIVKNAQRRNQITPRLISENSKKMKEFSVHKRKCASVLKSRAKLKGAAKAEKNIQKERKILETWQKPIEFLVFSTKFLQILSQSIYRASIQPTEEAILWMEELTPIIRSLADQLKFLASKENESLRKEGLGKRERAIAQKRMDTELCGKGETFDRQNIFCNLAGNQARRMLRASYYNNENLLSGALRQMAFLLGDRWENQFSYSENWNITEQSFEMVSSFLRRSRQLIGLTGFKALDYPIKSSKEQSILKYNQLAKAEILLEEARFNSRYSVGFVLEEAGEGEEVEKKTVKSPGDSQRYESLADLSFFQIQKSLEHVKQFKPGFNVFSKAGKGESCLENPKSSQAIGTQKILAKIYTYYGKLYLNFSKKAFKDGKYKKIIDSANALSIPMDFVERPDILLLMAKSAEVDSRYDWKTEVYFAGKGIEAFLLQLKNKIPAWRPINKKEDSKSCQIVAYSPEKIDSEELFPDSEMIIQPRCEVLYQLLGHLKYKSNSDYYEMNKKLLREQKSIDWESYKTSENLSCKKLAKVLLP